MKQKIELEYINRRLNEYSANELEETDVIRGMLDGIIYEELMWYRQIRFGAIYDTLNNFELTEENLDKIIDTIKNITLEKFVEKAYEGFQDIKEHTMYINGIDERDCRIRFLEKLRKKIEVGLWFNYRTQLDFYGLKKAKEFLSKIDDKYEIEQLVRSFILSRSQGIIY